MVAFFFIFQLLKNPEKDKTISLPIGVPKFCIFVWISGISFYNQILRIIRQPFFRTFSFNPFTGSKSFPYKQVPGFTLHDRAPGS